jgi:hypothetical protein
MTNERNFNVYSDGYKNGDPQKTRLLYTLENQLEFGHKLTIYEANLYVAKIMSSQIFKQKFQHKFEQKWPRVVQTNNTKYHFYVARTKEIKVAGPHIYQLEVIHELAHAIQPKKSLSHGQHFIEVYLWLLKVFYKKVEYKKFKRMLVQNSLLHGKQSKFAQEYDLDV